MSFVVAAAQYPIDKLESWDGYAAKLERWVGEAAGAGAKLLIFPEYGAMELAALDPASMGDLAGSLATVSALLPRVDALHARLAARHGVHILAASAPWRREDGNFVNRARLFAPGGGIGVQDKLIMTRFERETWGVTAGTTLHVFETELGRMGIAICYDCEFPLLARALAAAGAQILLVPSCTDNAQGYWRVRLGAQARALENQCYVVQSSTVGRASWSPAVDENHGAAGIYGPPDGPFPADGAVATGIYDEPQWVLGEIDLGILAQVRANGAVFNLRDWAEQPGAQPPHPVKVVSLVGLVQEI